MNNFLFSALELAFPEPSNLCTGCTALPFIETVALIRQALAV